jgi:hypothetical protein
MSIDIRNWTEIHKSDLRDALISGDRIIISSRQAEQLLKENKDRKTVVTGPLKDRFVKTFGTMAYKFVIED